MEDEPIIAEQLVTQLSEIGYGQVDIANNSEEAEKKFVAFSPDFLIVDIGLKDSPKDGIELSSTLQSITATPCIFLSGFSDDATLSRVKQVIHSDYLIKPCSSRQLYVSIDRAIDEFTKSNLVTESIPQCFLHPQEDHFFIKACNNAYEKVLVSDILWIETVRGGIELHTQDSKNYILTASLNSFILQFQHKDLLRVHRSFLINKAQVHSIKDRSFVIKAQNRNKLIPCSQSYWNEIKSQFKTLKSD